MDEEAGRARRTAPRAPEGVPGARAGAATPPREGPAAPTPSRRCRPLAALCLVAALPGLAAAAPGLECGPETEARFLDRFADGGEAAGSCRRLMEHLQERLAYAVFLEQASGGSGGSGGTDAERRIAAAAAAPDSGEGRGR